MILEPQQYYERHDFCFFKMERLKPISGELLYQLYLGDPSQDQVIKENLIRGHYIGFKQASEIVDKYPRVSLTRSNIEQLCYDFGRLLGIIQLAAKFDALDYELVLSKSNGKIPYKISIIDFDQMSSIADSFASKNIKQIVDRVNWPLTAETYVPNPSDKCFSHFKAGYLDLARELDIGEKTGFYSEVANAILNMLEKELSPY